MEAKNKNMQEVRFRAEEFFKSLEKSPNYVKIKPQPLKVQNYNYNNISVESFIKSNRVKLVEPQNKNKSFKIKAYIIALFASVLTMGTIMLIAQEVKRVKTEENKPSIENVSATQRLYFCATDFSIIEKITMCKNWCEANGFTYNLTNYQYFIECILPYMKDIEKAKIR